MALIVRAFPLRRSVEELRLFAVELASKRKEEAAAFYRRLGVSQESWHLQDTADGPLVIGVTMMDDPEAAAQSYQKGSAEFEAWFREQVRFLSGVNPAREPLGPPTSQIFSWADDKRPA